MAKPLKTLPEIRAHFEANAGKIVDQTEVVAKIKALYAANLSFTEKIQLPLSAASVVTDLKSGLPDAIRQEASRHMYADENKTYIDGTCGALFAKVASTVPSRVFSSKLFLKMANLAVEAFDDCKDYAGTQGLVQKEFKLPF
ncbi:MAG: hypothetical protein OXT65_08090 [Alphaproteobacteria bacterium]|nr:hypothetical protein [Alphaproteobacteria bacterium]